MFVHTEDGDFKGLFMGVFLSLAEAQPEFFPMSQIS
jgi:hypothetical protein